MRKLTLQECDAERDYIQAIDATHPGQGFNHDARCFARYCDMQAKHMRWSGHRLSAYDVLQARDIAWPTYRADNSDAA